MAILCDGCDQVLVKQLHKADQHFGTGEAFRGNKRELFQCRTPDRPGEKQKKCIMLVLKKIANQQIMMVNRVETSSSCSSFTGIRQLDLSNTVKRAARGLNSRHANIRT